jgi:ppGpp synthetase/RelA/SpoT-type nucleotidyltranferase
MTPAEVERIMRDYKDNHWQYQRLTVLARRFLAGRVRKHFPTPSVPILQKEESRTKKASSLKRNLEESRYEGLRRSSGSQLDLASIGDLAAVRLIFFFRDDLDEFAELEEWKDWFGDKPRPKIPSGKDKHGRALFGYNSYHADIKIEKGTVFYNVLMEHDRNEIDKLDLDKLRIEIQLRTVLQHAWAEPEHDLRYKSDEKLPPEKDRQWGMLAGLLEAGDCMFDRLKAEIIAIKKKSLTTDSSTAKPGTKILGTQEPERSTPEQSPKEQRDYEVLCRSAPLVEVLPEMPLFSVNKAMYELCNIKNFKARVWRELSPSFRASLAKDNVVARLTNWEDARSRNDARSLIVVQPARYSDQMVTNHKQAHSIMIDERRVDTLGKTESGEMLPFNESPLSNTLGIAAMMYTSDKRWVVLQRASHPAYEPDKLGCSVSGVLEWREPSEWSDDPSKWWTDRIHGTGTNFGVLPESAKFDFLALTRETQRLGKPQIFYLVELGVPEKKVDAYLQISHDGEPDERMFLTDEDAESVVNTGRHKGKEATAELKMNLRLALEFLRKPKSSDGAAVLSSAEDEVR